MTAPIPIGCRRRLPSPELAGFVDVVDPETGEVLKSAVDALREAAARSPDLRPCPRRRWNWIYRTTCRKCPEAVWEKGEKKEPPAALMPEVPE